MTEYLLTAGISLLGLSASLFVAGYTHKVASDWMEGLQIFELTTIGYQTKEKIL